MSEADADERSISEDNVAVDCRIESEQFAIPTAVFKLQSRRDAPVTVRLVVTLPDGVDRGDIGFHDDYGAEHWAAGEERLRFDYELAADEEFFTVFAVRELGDAGAALLDAVSVSVSTADDEPGDVEEPAAEETAHTVEDDTLQTIEDVVGREEDRAVRELIAGDRDALPGLESNESPDIAAASATGVEAETEPTERAEEEEEEIEEYELADPSAESDPPVADDAGIDATADDAGIDATADDVEVDDTTADDAGIDDTTTDDAEVDATADDAEVDATADDAAANVGEQTAEPTDEGAVASGTDEDAAAPEGTAEGAAPAVSGGVASTLLEELQAGRVSAEERELLAEELHGSTRSTEVRIDHLQNQVTDLTAYTDALEAFIDENGSGRELLEELRDEVSTVEHELDDLQDDVAALETEIEDLQQFRDRMSRVFQAFEDL